MSEKKTRKKPTKRAWLPNVIGQYIMELRKRKGRSQEEVANELGLSKAQVSRWERGEIEYPDHILETYAKAWLLETSLLLSIRNKPPGVNSPLLEDVAGLREAVVRQRDVAKALKSSGAVLMPIGKSRVGKRPEPVAEQLDLPLAVGAEGVKVLSSELIPGTARKPAFLPWLIEFDKKVPCPEDAEGREGWLLAMSKTYQFV